MNLPGLVQGLACVFRPSRLLPSITVDEFSDLPQNIADALKQVTRDEKIDIRALVLDKDNCFARPLTTEIWPKYQVSLSNRSEYRLHVS